MPFSLHKEEIIFEIKIESIVDLSFLNPFWFSGIQLNFSATAFNLLYINLSNNLPKWDILSAWSIILKSPTRKKMLFVCTNMGTNARNFYMAERMCVVKNIDFSHSSPTWKFFVCKKRKLPVIIKIFLERIWEMQTVNIDPRFKGYNNYGVDFLFGLKKRCHYRKRLLHIKI